MALGAQAGFLRDEKKYSEEIPVRIEMIRQIKEIQKEEYVEEDEIQLSIHRSHLAFAYLMSENLAAAKKQIFLYEKMYEKLSPSDNPRIDTYYLCKAIIDAKENRLESATSYFDKAESAARKNKYMNALSNILEQRLI
ncbi:hypothetical protein AB4Y90_17920 [Chryseobacterium sp. 2TAF14]|uniref:hypothetical protein n=1 Tax=Chryseobacterium sp. 2TAF14 TaxID=3233007 RepID=UPI003F8F83B0